MTLADQLLTDIDNVFNNTDRAEFAVMVIYNAVTFGGIYDNPFAITDLGVVDVENTEPQVRVAAANVVGIAHNDAITVNSISYKVLTAQPDGTGWVLVMLSLDNVD